MQCIDLGLVAGEDLAAFWRRMALIARDWLAAQGAPVRDAVLLLPFAQQIAPARRAWVGLGGWQPRIATSHSLAAALGPTALAGPGQISGDVGIDAFAAEQLLDGQSWARDLKRQSARDYRIALRRLVLTAHALQRAASQQPPTARAAFLEAAQARWVAAPADAGQLERALALVALAWVAADERRPATDSLFEQRPSAWIRLRAGGPDPLAQALLEHSPGPALCLNADLALDDFWAATEPAARVELAVCRDFEALAEHSATAVLMHMNAGRSPVALLAQDRVVVRRVRALLARQGVPVHDETGWTLATTPAAAALMALLRAVLQEGALDDWLAWLKSPLADGWDAGAVSALEALCRRRGWRLAHRLDGAVLPPGVAGLWARARAAAAPLAGGSRSLATWLADLNRALAALADLSSLDGGAALLEALWLSRMPWPGSAHESVLNGARLRPDEFLAWVDETLEASQFAPQETGRADVVITPMARAMLRPFGAVVLPGADAATLGPVPPRVGLLSDAEAAALGLPSIAEQQDAQALAFAQLLRAPALTLLRCMSAGSEPLATSPLLERLLAAARRAGRPQAVQAWQDDRVPGRPARQPQARASAAAAGHLPASLSASSIEALRDCPYRFFSRTLLGLQEAEELDSEPDRRDYGTWLHAVLKRFHDSRSGDDDADLAGATEVELARLDAVDFLPFAAAFERLRPRYLDWLRETEAAGQRYQAGEQSRECQPFAPPLDGITLRGRIDRIDEHARAELLLDYKTGDAKTLKDKLKQPLEDTQLAAYALLEGERPGLQAAYIVLDDAKGVTLLAHPDVTATAAALRAGLQTDLLALRAGAPLPALGEGRICEHCEARGLCRKDDWASTPAGTQAAPRGGAVGLGGGPAADDWMPA